ncbi:RRP15-like protein [Aplochiton taeniatus]
MSVLAVGDFYQLPPPGKAKPLCVFEEHVLDFWEDNFKMISLTEIMCQKDDVGFANCIDFDERKIYAVEEVTTSMKNMRRVTFDSIMTLLKKPVFLTLALTIIHHNTEGLLAHMGDIKRHHELQLADILCFTETHLSGSSVAASLDLEGYTIFKRNRNLSTYSNCPEMARNDDEPQEDIVIEPGDSDTCSSDDGGSEEAGDDGGSEEDGSDEGEGDGPFDGSEVEQAENDKGTSNRGENGTKEGDKTNPNAGWAEAMAKILAKKTPESKPTIMLKNKELDKIKEEEKKEALERKKQVDKKQSWENMCRVKPHVLRDREKERNLQRISTRGVVQLFNAVRKQQKTVDEKVKLVGGSERKKAKLLSSVSKKDFINVLRGNSVAVKKEKQTALEESEEKPAWSVLRDDFMMGACMKDWDKDSDSDGDEGGKPETQSGAVESNSD